MTDQIQKDLCDSLVGASCRGKLLRFHQLGSKRQSIPIFDIEHGRVRTVLHQLRQNDVGDCVWKGATSEQGGIRFWPAETKKIASGDDQEDEHRLTLGKVYELTITDWRIFNESVFKYDTGLAWSVAVQQVGQAR